jgi:hypothetical protein
MSGKCTYMEKIRSEFKILIIKPTEKKKNTLKNKCRLEDNIKIHVSEIGAD